MNNKDIDKLRKEIDYIDDKLLQLIIDRSSIVEKIGYLKDNTKTIVDKNRETKILNKLIKAHKGNYPKDSIIRLWREIFNSSANLQLKEKYNLLPKRGISEIKLYKGGTAKILGKENIIKLSSNESPFGPSPRALEAYIKTSSKLSRYPELTSESLQSAIAKKFQLNEDQIICGTGSDEILIFTSLAFCAPGDEVIHALHGFEMYPIIAKYAGAESVLASETNYKIDTQSILNNINESTKLILIANPNNPTSTYLNHAELRSMMNKIPNNIVVVLDAAYAEFADAKDYDNTFSLAEEYNNVIITRTFSKAYSLAGLRLGWGYGSKILIDMIKKLRPPFNLPPGAIAAGIAAINDDQHLQEVVNHNNKIKSWFVNELNNLGLKAYKTQTNFVFVIVPEKKYQSASKINDFLLSRGVAVRYLLSYGLENALRITLGTKEELTETIKLLKEFLKNNE